MDERAGSVDASDEPGEGFIPDAQRALIAALRRGEGRLEAVDTCDVGGTCEPGHTSSGGSDQ